MCSSDLGKESIPGYLRVYARGEVLVVADSSEAIDGEPLFVKLVEQGQLEQTANLGEGKAKRLIERRAAYARKP